MKCKYCNAEVALNARFCTTCGKDLSVFNKCVKCGELLDNDTVFCPHCGAEQPHEEPKEKESSKKWIWAVAAVLLLGLIGGYYYLSQNRDSFSGLAKAVDTDSIEVEEPIGMADKESLEKDLFAILSSVLSPSFELEDMHKYFTEGYISYYKRACEKAEKEGCEYPRIWWQQSDSDPDDFSIKSIKALSDDKASCDLKLTGGLYTADFEVVLKKEKGNWVIDEVIQKDLDYLEDFSEDDSKKMTDAYTNILNEYAKKGKDSTYGYLYFLYDITADGVPELWIQVEGDRDDELNCKLLIYEFKDGALSQIYQERVGHPAHHSFIKADDCICFSFEHMGSSLVEKYEYKNGKIQTMEIETDENEEIETYEITDRTPITNLKKTF